ncbi:lipoyl synthase [Rodentibacter pneumotropicus]|uniref:Lipoyl synthase n=1 Tax=Rodentibacter pneumotropicus TaxID=758 RepID=A0A3S4W0M0_9PAST|nr:lipoyl synthase [Rodentibacter pneumotropicus]
MSTPFKMERGVKYRDAAKTSIIPVKNIDPNQELLKKPEWMKIKLPASSVKLTVSKMECVVTACIPSVKRPLVRIYTNVLIMVRQPL